MDDLDKITNFFEKERKRVNCFSPFHIPEFIEPKLDFKIDTELFLGWLSFEDKYYEEENSYAKKVSSMCEYSCLFVAMFLYKKKLKGDLRIIYGKYGFWEHYWLKYTLNGKAYYLDLTLQQFIPESPKFAISQAKQNAYGYNSNYENEGETIKDYVERKRAFQFYEDPNCF